IAAFRRLIQQLLVLVAAAGLVCLAGFGALGPFVTGHLFRQGSELSNLDFALLSVSCTGFMAAQVLSQALISLTGYRRVAAGWTAGGATFVVVTLLGTRLFLRVELGLFFGAVIAIAVMSACLLPLLRAHERAAGEPLVAAAQT